MRVVIHAPTKGALSRARSNARNLKAAESDCTVEIVVNAEAVSAALNDPDTETDDVLRLCGNTLKRTGREARADLEVVDAAIAHLVRRVNEGWIYIRA